MFQWPKEEAPGGVRIFACQRLLEGEARAEGAFRVVATGPRRAEIAFAPRGAIAEAHPGLDADGMPERGSAGLVLRTGLPPPPTVATGCALVFATD